MEILMPLFDLSRTRLITDMLHSFVFFIFLRDVVFMPRLYTIRTAEDHAVLHLDHTRIWLSLTENNDIAANISAII